MTFIAGHSFVFCCPSVFKIQGCGDGSISENNTPFTLANQGY